MLTRKRSSLGHLVKILVLYSPDHSISIPQSTSGQGPGPLYIFVCAFLHYCTVLYPLQYCTLCCTPNCTVPLTVLYPELYCTLYCTLLYCALYCAMPCIVLYRVLYYTLYWTPSCTRSAFPMLGYISDWYGQVSAAQTVKNKFGLLSS